jgi:two-component system phosphate regulon sensor histidine kinase PhoR
MRWPIFLKIFTGFLVVTLALSLLISIFSHGIIRSSFREMTADRLKAQGIPLRDLAAPMLAAGDTSGLARFAVTYGPQIDARITILNTEGRVLADSEKDPSTMENHGDRPEIREALKGAIGQSIRYSSTLKNDLLYLALPIIEGGRLVGVLRMSVTLDHIEGLMQALFRRLAVLTAVVMALSLLTAALFSHFISAPIRELAVAAGRLASGELSVRVSPRSSDEIHDLTESFNYMAHSLELAFSELSAGKEELEAVLSSVTEILLVLDSEGRIIMHNQAALGITQAQRVRDRYYWELYRSGSLDEMLKLPDRAPCSGEVEIQGRTYLCSVNRLASRDVRVVTLHDITYMKEMDRFKKDLVVNVSHELRTPLTAIKGFTETCLEETEGGLKEHLSVILRHTDRLISMVNDLLTLSELEEKPAVQLDDVRMAELLRNVLVVYEPRIRAKGLDLKVQAEDLTLKADPFLLEQLLMNLVDNAFKYTEKGSITISAHKMNQNAVIIVSDTGIGIPKEHIPRIFERFYVVDRSRSRSTGGTGLGLSIARHIAEIHQGEIIVESSPPLGTTFKVILPLF